jgi:multidrug efflux pump subunit AcrA (membrane-fusion protein)
MTDPARQPSLVRRIAGFVFLVIVGVGVYVWLQSSRPEPRRRTAEELGRPVRVIELAPLEVVPRTVGYGVVEAQREWQALAEVSGLVVEMHERLEVGRVVQAGTVLLRIDPGGYEIEQSRSQATVKAVRAQIAELQARETSAATNLKIEERSLELARKEYENLRKLYEEGSAPLMEVEAAERALISAEKAVQGYRNTLNELPASRRVLQAQLEQQEAGVATTRLDLARTEIVAPFTMRLREVNVGLQQVVGAGTVLLIGDGVDVFEIPAQIPVGSLGPLLPPRPPEPEPVAGEPPAPTEPPPRTWEIEAIVRLESQGVSRTWTGKFDRFGGIDPATRTMLAVVQIDDPRRDGQRGPRLNRGLFVEVELRGSPRPDCLAIPRDAYHDGIVHVVGAEDRLELREVEAALIQEQFICITGEIAAGDRVVVTDLVPAIAGTLLAPRPDDEAVAALARDAKAEEDSP